MKPVFINSIYGLKCYFKQLRQMNIASCDFEKDLCEAKGFKPQTKTSGFRWYRQAGQTSSYGTGPNGDHTTGNGHYLYVEATRGVTNDTAFYELPQLPANQDVCLDFWYNMFGKTMGSLHVILKGPGRTEDIFSKSGNLGQVWLHETLTVPSQSQNYTLSFKAIRGWGYQSDAAIDDVKLTTGKCE